MQVAWRPHCISILSSSFRVRCSNPRSPPDPSLIPLWSSTKPLDLVQFCLSGACLLKQHFCVCPRRRKSIFLLVSLSSRTSTRDNPGATSWNCISSCQNNKHVFWSQEMGWITGTWARLVVPLAVWGKAALATQVLGQIQNQPAGKAAGILSSSLECLFSSPEMHTEVLEGQD